LAKLPPMNQYITLLRAEPLLRRLSLVQLIAYFGAWFSNVAIYTLLIHMEVSPFIIAMTAAMHFLPGVLQAPFSGVLIDKVAPKQLMMTLMVIEIFATLPFMLIDNSGLLWLLFILVFIRMGASSFYFTLEMSLLPRILDGEKLKLANEIHSVIWSFSYTFGMAVSGFVVYLVGVKTAFFLDALLFSIALMLLKTLIFPLPEEKAIVGFGTMFKESFVYFKNEPHIKHLILLHAFVGFTTFDALVALMVKQYYTQVVAVALGLGLMHSLRAVGLVFGPIVIGKWVNTKTLPYLFLYQALSIIIWALVIEDFYLSLFVSIFVGFSTTTLWSYTYTLLQHHTAKEYYGRIVAYNDMVFLLTVALISIAIGYLAEVGLTLAAITMLLGSAFIVGAFYFIWIRKRFSITDMADNNAKISPELEL
jgi:DHA3 family macrolide efflux protein-like MFS transporter